MRCMSLAVLFLALLGSPAWITAQDTAPKPAAAAMVKLTWKNQSTGEVQIFWVDPAGKEVAYGSVKPGESGTQTTFASHGWLFRSANGALIGRLTATDRDQVVRFEANGTFSLAIAPPVNPAGEPKPAEPATREIPAPDKLASPRTRDTLEIVWKNGLKVPVTFSKLDSDGKEIIDPRNVIEAGSEFGLTATVGQVFLFKTAEGAVRTYVAPFRMERELVVNIPSATPTDPYIEYRADRGPAPHYRYRCANGQETGICTLWTKSELRDNKWVVVGYLTQLGRNRGGIGLFNPATKEILEIEFSDAATSRSSAGIRTTIEGSWYMK